MKNYYTLLLLCVFCITFSASSQSERPLNELLDLLSQNHMGSVTDVFTLEEIQVIKDHYAETTFPANNESVLLNKRYSSTQNVAVVEAVDVDPLIPSAESLLSSPISAFPGAGVNLRGTVVNSSNIPRIIVIDDDGHLWERGPGQDPVTITDKGQLTGIPAGYSITGLEVLTGTEGQEIYGLGTNGTNGTILVKIKTDDMTVTPVGGNNGLILPIALAKDKNNNLITIDIDDDNAYSLDKETGAATLIGSVGYDANFGQALFFDPFSNEIMNMAYNGVIGDSELRSLNPLTGMTMSWGTIDPGTVQQFGWGSVYDRDEILYINENGIEGFDYYPNPINDQITLRATNSIENIELYSLLGALVYKRSSDAREVKVDLSALQSGNYILRVTSTNQTAAYKIIKQ